MKNVFWFSRHAPTPAQVYEIESNGYNLVANEASYALGNVSIDDPDDLKLVVTGLLDQCKALGADICAGVFPAPIAEVAMRSAEDAIELGDYRTGTVSLVAAWNVTRSPDGGRPTFEHRRFCRVGILHPYGLGWY